MNKPFRNFIILLGVGWLLPGIVQAMAEPRHALSMHGTPLYPPDFRHFAYVNPDASPGGRLTLAVSGSFDSLNPMIVRGVPAAGLREHVFESLMGRSYDEPFSLYGLLAESIETPDDRSWVAFRIRENARFSDGKPVSVDDVVFSLETLRDKGRPNHRHYYSRVVRVEKTGRHEVKFFFDDRGDRELPLIIGLMPVLPRHIYQERVFDQTSLKLPTGSGPYIVSRVDPGVRITYSRNPAYWGGELALNKGRHNIAQIVYEYYRDANASFEAFKAGLYDARAETKPIRWNTEYNFPAVNKGEVRKVSFSRQTPSGMRAIVFNTRRQIFRDIRVRMALGYLFDFQWINKNLYSGAYRRTESYFEASSLSSSGRPASEAERTLLAPYPRAVKKDILEAGYQAPVSDGSGQNRSGRRTAIGLLKEAGWEIIDEKMIHRETGNPMRFEMLIADPEDERLALLLRDSLQAVGIDARIRTVDSSQYQQRRQTFDFDVIFNFWYASLSPGNEQSFYWGSGAARAEGSRNYMGVESPAVDAMISALLMARSREDFVTAVRALDRVLLSGYYVIPLFYQPEQWVALRKKVRIPEQTSIHGYQMDSWWIEEEEDYQGAEKN